MNNPERIAHAPDHFQQRVNQILSRPLTPEVIETYADNALSDLIEVAEDATKAFHHAPTISAETPKASEDAAFDYFRLENLETTLDYVAGVANDIDHLNAVIARARTLTSVILPPEKRESVVVRDGNGEFKEKSLVPRLKTLLFVLEKDFNIDLNDKEQVSISAGIVTDSMMRNETYYSVTIPELNRVVLVNDEEDNATFVFDSTTLETLNIDVDTIHTATKQTLNELITRNIGLGRRIVYSRQFVHNIKEALARIEASQEDTGEGIPSQAQGYLAPHARSVEGIKSAKASALDMGMSREKFLELAETLADQIGEAPVYLFGSVTTNGYSEEQRQLIKAYYESQKRPLAPEDIVSCGGLAKELGVSAYLIQTTIDKLGDGLGRIDTYAFGNRTVQGYTEQQKQMIIDALNQDEKLSEKAPDGYKSITGFAHALGVAKNRVFDAVDALRDELGEIHTYRFASMVTDALSKEQQEIIRVYLDKDSVLEAPEGILSAVGLAKKCDVSPKVIQKAIMNDELRTKIGETNSYRFKTKTAEGYTPEQQTVIIEWLANDNQLDIQLAPEDYVSLAKMEKTLKLGYEQLSKAVKVLNEKLGDVQYYRFGTRKAPGYSPAQQQLIIDYIKETSVEPAPENYETEYGVVRKYKLARHVVALAIKQLGPEIGTSDVYLFAGGPTRGFDEHQQDMIVRIARQNNQVE